MEKLKRFFSKEYWTMYLMVILPTLFIIVGIKDAVLDAIMVRILLSLCLQVESSPLCIAENGAVGILVGHGLSGLLVLCAGIGLAKKQNWARVFIFIVFPHYFIHCLLLQYLAVENILFALLRCSLVVILYIVIVWLYTRPKVREQFK